MKFVKLIVKFIDDHAIAISGILGLIALVSMAVVGSICLGRIC